MLEILVWLLIGSYVAATFYALAESLASRHVLTRSWSDKARVAWEAVVWPPEELWLQLRQSWSRLPIRYSEVAS